MQKPLRKRLIRSAIILLTPVILVLLAHLWLINHAENLISDAVYKESKGTVSLKLADISYNYRTHKLHVKKAELFNHNTDSLTHYRVRIPEITIEIGSLKELIFQRKLNIHSLSIPGPYIEVTRKSRKNRRNDVSLSTEMGRVYNAVRQALQRLQVKQTELTNGTFVLKDQSRSTFTETQVSNIFFRIDNLMISDSTSHTGLEKPFFADNIQFKTTQQKIDLPGGRHRIGFRAFSINMKNQLLVMDSCYIESLDTSGNHNRIKTYFDTILLSKIDFGALYRDQIIRADSVYCAHPELELEIVNKEKSEKNKKPSLKEIFRDIGANMDFKHIVLKEAGLSIQTGRRNEKLSFSGKNRKMELEGLRIIPDSSQPLSVDRFLLDANDYESYSPDSLYVIHLNRIGLQNQALRLENVSITTHKQRPGMAYRDHHIPLLTLSGLDWQALLFQKKIVADEIMLVEPVVLFRKSATQNTKPLKIYDAFDAVNDLVTVKKISVQKGKFHFELGKGTILDITGVEGTVHGKQLLIANNSQEMEQSVEKLHIGATALNTSKWNLEIKEAFFDGATATFTGKEMTLSDKLNTFSANARLVELKKFSLTDSLLGIEKISWNNAAIIITDPVKKNNSSHKIFDWSIGQLNGSNTQIEFRKKETTISTFLSTVNLRQLQQLNGRKVSWLELLFAGNHLNIHTPALSFQTGGYALNSDQEMVVKNPAVRFSKEEKEINLKADSLITTANIDALLRGKKIIPFIRLYQPDIAVMLVKNTVPQKTGTTRPTTTVPDIAIRNMQWIKPAVTIEQRSEKGIFRINNIRSENNQWNFGEMQSSFENGITISAMSISDSLEIRPPKATEPILSFRTTSLLRDFRIPLEKQQDITFKLTQIQMPELVLPGDDHKKLTDLRIHHGHISTGMFSLPVSQLLQIPGWEISATAGSMVNNRESFNIHGFNYQSGKAVSIDSFAYSPSISKDSFFAQQVFQTDYITASGGRLVLFHPEKNTDSLWRADSVHVNNFKLSAYRDKRLPFQHGTFKPLPATMLKRMNLPLIINKLVADSMRVQYSEWNDKTNKEGTVYLSIYRATLDNIYSRPDMTDTLHLNAHGSFIDDIPFSISIDQAYHDSLENMKVVLNAGPGRLTNLNRFLPALASVYVKHGRFTTLRMEATAGNETATGEILFRYQNLHIRILKKGNVEKKAFLPGIITFIADQFLLKHSNVSRKGIFIQKRNQEKSVFNYLVKILIRGAGTGTGLLKNKKAANK